MALSIVSEIRYLCRMNYVREISIRDDFGKKTYDVVYTEEGPCLVLKSDTTPQFIIQERFEERCRELMETFRERLADRKA